jgi:hypothetical protein
MTRSWLLVPIAVAILHLAAPRARALPVDQGTFWINIDDTAVPPAMSGQATFTGLLSASNPINITGSLLGFTPGPPGEGYGNFVSTHIGTQLAYHLAGTYVCDTAGCNSGVPVTFIGPVSSPTGALVGLLPTDSTYTIDGAGGYTTAVSGVPQCSPPPAGHRCFQGTFGFNAFQQQPTPASASPVTVSDSTTYFNSLAHADIPVTTQVTFEGGVSSPGTTTFSTVSDVGAPLPANFLTQAGAYQAQFTDIVTDAVYSGPVVVCTTYQDTNHDGRIDGTPVSVCDLRLLHQESGVFTDRTMALTDPLCPLSPSSPCPGSGQCMDPQLETICARVDHLSLFTAAVFTGDTDGDGVPDTADVCTRRDPGQSISAAKVKAKNLQLGLGQQAVVWTGRFVPAGPPSSLTLETKGVHLRLDDAACLVKSGGYYAPFDVDLPPGLLGGPSVCDPRHDGWSAHGSSTWKYRNGSGFLDAACSIPAQGITKVLVKDLRAKGGGVKFAVAAAPVTYRAFSGAAAPCRLQGDIVLAAAPAPGTASAEAMAGECGEFVWDAPVSAEKPPPFCVLKPDSANPTKETCTGP